jgi:REP element-mobilizing transposase RayT
LFGDVVGDEVILSTLGCIVLEEWERTVISRLYVTLDEFVVMPNHVHGIIVIDYGANPSIAVGARRAVPLQTPARSFGQSIPGALSTIVGAFKSAATKRINRVRETPGAPVWQRNFYEHVIRDEKGLNAILEYLQFNPARWAEDQENPANVEK